MKKKKKNPKILHLITRFMLGGSEEKTIIEIEHLNDKYRYFLGTGSEYTINRVKYIKSLGVNCKKFEFLRHYNPISLFFSIFEISIFLKEYRFDIVHTHGSEMGIVGRIAAKMAGVPIIIHSIHGTPFGINRNLLLNKFLIFCEQIAGKSTDRFLSNSDIITQRFLDNNIGKKAKFRTIYSGIDIKKFQNAKPIKIAFVPDNSIKILIASRLAKGKGWQELIESANIILGKKKEVSFLIAGDGKYKNKIKDFIKVKNLKNNFHFLDYRNDIEKIYKSVDIFVLPSYKEGTPRVITEAMASGLPIVATNIDGIPEQVKHKKNGFLIETKNHQALADALLKLIENPRLRSKMGKESTKLVKKFSSNKMIKDIDNLYQELIKQKL